MKRNKLADSHVNEENFCLFYFCKRKREKNTNEKVGEMMNGSIIGGADKSKNKSWSLATTDAS